MKKLLFIAAFTAVSFLGQAQDDASSPLRFSIGFDAALQLGDFGDAYSFGIGGSVQADYSVAEQLALTLSAGYMNYSGKTVSGFKIPSTGLVPVLAGIKYSFTENLYGSAQLGMSFSTEKNGGSSFTYAPGIGYKFTPNFDALLKYTGMSDDGTNLNQIGLRLAYTF
ncbi:MAG TPA: outer membrane beta-barrel protein [Ferruginibacter sp.]|nr:outer membrane beta-barrel protein [Ferruginibacter sp.]